MKHKEHSDSLERELKQYILGQLTELEEGRYEERLMSDDEFFREVEGLAEVVQDELVEDYLSGELTGEQKSAFEQRLPRSSEARAKLSLGRALLAIGKRKQPRPSWGERFRLWTQPLLQPAPALASGLAFALLAGGAWSVSRVWDLQNQLAQADAQQTLLTAIRESLSRQLEQERQLSSRMTRRFEEADSRLAGLEKSLETVQSRGIAALASFILKPGLQRSGGETTQVPITSGQKLVELKLDLGLDDYQSYRATLYDSSGDEVLAQSKLRAVSSGDNVYVVLQLPTQVLHGDDYQVRLSGVTASRESEMIDRYPFRVVPQ